MPGQVIESNQSHFDTHLARPWKAKVQLPEEKFTDVALGVHLVRDFYRNECEQAILVTYDADFKPAVELYLQDGHCVGVVSPDRTVSRDLARVASWSKPMRPDLPSKCQMPDTVMVGSRTVSKPRA